MNRVLIVLALAIATLPSCTHSYYIVRHADKAIQQPNLSSDVPLTDKGKQRAEALKEILKNKKIAFIFSTNTIRAKSTAQPTADYFRVPIEIYGPKPDSAFITLLRSKKKNTLVVGHSNTVDDLVNMLCGQKKVAGDLPDGEYNKLYVVKVKGKKARFTEAAILSSVVADPRF